MYHPSTVGFKVGGTIRLDHCASEGQTCSNNDFGRRHTLLVTGRKWKNGNVDKPIGGFHLHPEDLKRTAVLTSKENANVNKRWFDDALENQFVNRRRKEYIALEKKYEYATDDYIACVHICIYTYTNIYIYSYIYIHCVYVWAKLGSRNSNSSDDSHYRRKRRRSKKHRKKDPIRLCATLTAKLLTTAFK